MINKRTRHVIVVLAALLFLTGCQTSKSFVTDFKSGVNDALEVYGDSQNIINILGKTKESGTVSLINKDTGIIVGSSDITNGTFKLQANGFDEKTALVLTADKLAAATYVDTDNLSTKVELAFIPNQFLLAPPAETPTTENSQATDDDAFDVGETIDFANGLKVTLDSYTLAEDQQTIDIRLTIDNDTEEAINLKDNLSLTDADGNQEALENITDDLEELAKQTRQELTVTFRLSQTDKLLLYFGPASWEITPEAH